MSLPLNTTLPEALKILGIEEYGERIFKSNSSGELFHLKQYFILADSIGNTECFPKWFKSAVEIAEKEWKRPESVFQHIAKMCDEYIHEHQELVTWKIQKECGECWGSGWAVQFLKPCSKCGGTGHS
jgi:hypothetical protein